MSPTNIDNPLSRGGFWLTLIVFAFIGVTLGFGFEKIFDAFGKPLLFFAASYATIWAIFQFRTGTVSIVSQGGSWITYKRASEPIGFFIVITMLFCMSAFLAFVFGTQLFFGCEYDFLATCR